MKHLRLLYFVGQFVFLFNAVALADENNDESSSYIENYRFSLSYTTSEDRQTDIEFVVSAKNFKLSAFDPKLDLSGTILNVGGKTLVLQYDLRIQKNVVTGNFDGRENQNPFQTVSVIQGGLTSNVRLRLGTPVEILKVGNESARLTVTKQIET